MKDDDVFKEIGQGMVIWVMLCLAPLFFCLGIFTGNVFFIQEKVKLIDF